MQTDALDLAKHHANNGMAERLSWGLIELQVTDLNRSVDFWTNALGLQQRDHDGPGAALGTRDKTLFLLQPGATRSVEPRHTGMYHVAMGVPDQAEFSRILARLISKGVRVSPTDHLMSKAIYIADPDGLEIEIALETPERFGRFGDMSKGLILYDAAGQPHSGRAPLDVSAELAHAQTADLNAPISDGAFLAHLHLKVNLLEAGANWFEGIGFARNLMLPNWGFADMGAGASYSHRLAMNVWNGTNLTRAPADMARLTHYTLHLLDPDILPRADGLHLSGVGLTGLDPSGTEMTLIRAV